MDRDYESKEYKDMKSQKMAMEKEKVVEITNKQLSVINANKSIQFDCPSCKYNLIELDISSRKPQFTHNYCAHCGARVIWNLSK